MSLEMSRVVRNRVPGTSRKNTKKEHSFSTLVCGAVVDVDV